MSTHEDSDGTAHPTHGNRRWTGPIVETHKMGAWQERLLIERDELDSKIAKLDHFLHTPDLVERALPSERERLTNQLFVMRAYSQLLLERINCWK